MNWDTCCHTASTDPTLRRKGLNKFENDTTVQRIMSKSGKIKNLGPNVVETLHFTKVIKN